MEFIDLIKNRRSIRKYQDKPVPKEVLQELLDCARLAPTAANGQQWLIGCVTDKAKLQPIAEATLWGKFIKNAPACFAVFCKADNQFSSDDGCSAAMNIIYGATSKGLGSCWVWGDGAPYGDAVRDILHVPKDYRLVALVPLGYPAESPKPEKKPLADVSFWNSYN